MAVSESIARPVRTAVQMGLSAAIVQAVDATVDLTGEQVTAYTLLGTIVLSCVQAAVENRTGKALLRSIPPRDVPVADEAA